MDGSALYLCVAGAAVVAGIYVIWGPERLLRRKDKCVGLENLGNTCFLNAVLQALASTGCVLEWLESIHGSRLTAALQHTLQCLRAGDGGVVSPGTVLTALGWHGWSLDHRQQDAHEIYHVFLTTVAEEMITCPSLLSKPPVQLTAAVTVAFTRAGPISCIRRCSPCPLQGLLASELICLTCQHTSPLKHETFDSLSLNLPLDQSQCSLHSCLLDFIKSEILPDVECCRCSQLAGSKVMRTHTKRLQLARYSPILCLHLKRTVWLPSGNLHKNTVSVAFPAHLDISILSTSPSTSCGHSYELVAMIEHLGGPFSGHYIAYRHLHGSQWVQASDAAVYSCSLQDVLSANPYMLFYSRINNIK